jgi:hypothetical protein
MMDPEHDQTAASCIRSTCKDCAIQGKLLCIHTKRDLVDFAMLFLLYFIPFFILSQQCCC